MKALYYIFRKTTAPLVANLDLVLVWIVLLSAQPIVSTESPLSADHLAAWMMEDHSWTSYQPAAALSININAGPTVHIMALDNPAGFQAVT